MYMSDISAKGRLCGIRKKNRPIKNARKKPVTICLVGIGNDEIFTYMHIHISHLAANVCQNTTLHLKCWDKTSFKFRPESIIVSTKR
jgi:hypothetical protein